jgi:hypothetical protein
MSARESHWRVFRTGLLRSAGFPFEWLDDMASVALEHRSALLVDAYVQRERSRARTLRTLWEMRSDSRSADRPMINRALRRVRGRKTVAEPHARIASVTAEWNTVTARYDSVHDSLSAELGAMLSAEYEREIALLLSHVDSDYFKEAVLLSSPAAYEEFCRTSDHGRFRHGHERVAYRFLQRFSAKNESGGSIGPVNLIIAADEYAIGSNEVRYWDDPVLGQIAYVENGDGRSAERHTFLSYWAACELGRSLLQKSTARLPYRILGMPRSGLPDTDARLLDRIDGRTSVGALAAALELPVDAVESVVRRLVALGLVEDDWQVSYFTTNPGEELRELADRLGTPAAKRACQLVDEVRKFARVPFTDRPAALAAISRDFSQLTGKPAWRGHGRLRADRSVLYEEATGNIQDASIGPTGMRRLCERLATALELLASQAIEKRAAGQALLARELDKRGVEEMAAVDVRALAVGDPGPGTVRERLLDLLDASVSSVELSRGDLLEAGLIREDLDEWPVFGAADLMLTGLGSGPGSIILSELHHIWPTLGCWVRALYDDRVLANQELWQIVAGELAPAVPTLQEIVRNEKATDSSPYGHRVLCLDSGMPLADTVTVSAERTVVRRWQNGFIGLHDTDDRRDLWLLPEYDDSGVDLGGLLNCTIPALSLKPFTLGPHTPRIVIDGVVIQRRRWELAAATIPTATGRVPTGREWLALQVWRCDLGLPRCVYFLLDTEGKPIYLDFSSVLSVTNFLHCLRSAERVVVTEALPDPAHLWLRTRDGTLTSEIRLLLWRDRRSAVHVGS